MGLIYCILAYKSPAQIARLAKALEHPGNLCFVHFDKRSPRGEHRALAELTRDLPQLRIVPARPVLWGRYSIVSAQLDVMRQALQLDQPWSHFITLSGLDFPLRPQAEIAGELAAAPETSFVSFFDPYIENIWKGVDDRINRIYIDSSALESLLKIPFFGRRLRALLGWTNSIPFVPLIRRQKPAWLRYMGGSNHLILSRAAVDYTLNDPAACRVIDWLRFTAIPEEAIFQSVLLNSPLAGSIVNDDRRAIFWEKAGDPSPQTLRMSHLGWLREERAKGRLFARKFDVSVDNAVLCELEKDLGL